MDILAYTVNAPDGDGYYFPHKAKAFDIICPKCGSCIDNGYVPKNLKMSRTSYEVSSTYDNQLIVSGRFKQFCEDNVLQGACFDPVNENRKLYRLTSDRIVEFDAERRETEVTNLCELCGQYEEVIGAAPCFLKNVTKPLLKGFYRTDLEIGSGAGKSAVLLVGVETKPLIEAALFKRPEFAEVVS